MRTSVLMFRCVVLFLFVLIPVLAFGQQPHPSASASASPVSTAQSTPSPFALDPRQRTDDERQALLEYRVAEKVEERIDSRLRIYLMILAAVIGLVAFIGFASLRDLIARRVETDIKQSIEKDVESLRSKTQDKLIDLTVSLNESKRVGEGLQTQLESLRVKHEELEDLSRRFEALHGNVLEVTEKVENAIAVASESAQKADNLRQVVASSFAGEPTIVGESFGWFAGSTLTVSGSNFGNVPGKIFLIFYAFLVTDRVGPGISVARWKMPVIDVPQQLIEKWAENEIRLKISQDLFDKIQAFQKQANQEKIELGIAEIAFAYEARIERLDGAIAGYDPPLRPVKRRVGPPKG